MNIDLSLDSNEKYSEILNLKINTIYGGFIARGLGSLLNLYFRLEFQLIFNCLKF